MYNKIEMRGVVMFVSTYSTYLNTNSVNKTSKNGETSSSSSSKLFENSLKHSQTSPARLLQSTPITYISHNKTLGTKERINQQLQQNSYETDLKKLTTIKSQMQAPSAYAANTKMFSLIIKHPNTPKQVDNSPFKELKENVQRAKFVNTYAANEKYYELTA